MTLPNVFRIVVGIDFHEGSAHAVQEATALAVRLGDRTEIHAITAVEPSWSFQQKDRQLELVPHQTREFLSLHAAPVTDDARFGTSVHVRLGSAAAVLAQHAVDVDADLIVVGPHHKGMIDRRAVGSVTRRLLREAHCPVLVARPKAYFDVARSDMVEPPCPDCVAVRGASHGETFWCELHAGKELDRSHGSDQIHGGSREAIRVF